MLRNLLNWPVTQRDDECKIKLNQIIFEDSKSSLSEPIVGEHDVIKWSLTLERGPKVNRIKRLNVVMDLENASGLVSIGKMIPEDLQKEKATIQIGAGISVINIGVSIPIVGNIRVNNKRKPDEVEWVFDGVEFRQGNDITIEGAIELAFLPGSEDRLVSPTINVHATFGKGSFLRDTHITLQSEVGHISGLKPTLPGTQHLIGSKSRESFPIADVTYYNPNGSNTSENRTTINEIFEKWARDARDLKLLFYTGNTIFASVTSPMYHALTEKNHGKVQILLLDPNATDIIEERYKVVNSRVTKRT
jgi:hypothetical protein